MSSSPVADASAGAGLIGILVCDHVVDPELRAAAGGRDYGDMYDDMLRTAEAVIRTRVYDVVAGELPTDPGACDGWIITGARYDSYGEEPWLQDLRAFIERLHAARARTVGVCFGHQVIAHALGGEARPAGEWKAGPHRLDVAATAWFGGGEVWLHAMHQDVASQLPPGAVRIAEGTTAAHPMYLLDEHILCVQDHPEYDPRYIAALIEARRSRMGDETADAALARVADVGTHGATVARWLASFLLDRRCQA